MRGCEDCTLWMGEVDEVRGEKGDSGLGLGL